LSSPLELFFVHFTTNLHKISIQNLIYLLPNFIIEEKLNQVADAIAEVANTHAQ
jgi:hypothetical protein